MAELKEGENNETLATREMETRKASMAKTQEEESQMVLPAI